ncbi:hypothetical protein M2271_008507 [Streptomyces sp. LBL]|uniref:hypothetical protein n=1 Tax=Streptomyces sp. LBL TaxID=2940562 RepID=UPI002474158F|nr:hypothetical protein [Streptomyces sp. LBL]MDH6630646.1 hypothetical protein [Streptomyces sp. LBL]
MADQQQQQSSSSNEPFRVDTDKMKPAISKLEELADRLERAGHNLLTTSESYGTRPWGEDKNGKKFYAQYGKAHDQCVAAGLEGGAALHDSTERLAEMIKGFEATEEAAKETSGNLASDT